MTTNDIDITRTREAGELLEAIVSLRSAEECRALLRDLCTIAELRAMVERFQVAKLLDEGLTYRQINARLGSSTTTITRVAHWLRHGAGGYASALERRKGA